MRFSRLAEWLSWLETLHPVGIDLGLDRVRAVAGRLGVLQPGVPVITVAGTNGKGSVTALLEALLLRAGRIVRKAELEQLVLGFESELASNAIEVHVSALRRKLGRTLIETVRGLGYRIDHGA